MEKEANQSAQPTRGLILDTALRKRLITRLSYMKVFTTIGLLLLAGCSREPRVVQWSPSVEPTRESAIESAQKMSAAEVQKEEEPYRTWLMAQRSGICERHKAKMHRKWLPVAYGLPAAGSLPEPEEAARFPHGEESWIGGCLVTATKEREVFLCSECVAAYREWQTKKKSNSQHR